MQAPLWLLPLALLGLAPATSDDTDWEATAYRGADVNAAGDVNSDGFPDVVLGSFSEGEVHVYSGKKGERLYTLKERKGNYGWSVASAGDTNQDGHSEIVVGAPEEDTVYVYKGRKGKDLSEIEGEEGVRFGWDVAGAGDTNGDGFTEIVVASRGDGQKLPGSARLFSARSGEEMINLTDGLDAPCDVFAVGGAGDTNSDGFTDVIVGFPFEGRGTVRLYSGKDGELLHTLTGEGQGDGFGMAVSGAGDVDADGFTDLIVGAPFGADGAGAAYVYSGKTGSLLFQDKGEALGERFGHSVGAAGDPNLDGRGDVVVGAPGPPRDTTIGPFARLLEGMPEQAAERFPTRGRAVVLSGRGGDVLHEVTPEAEGDWFGIAVAGVGDVNTDGRSDFVVGGDAVRKGDRGVVARVYSGKEGEEVYAFEP